MGELPGAGRLRDGAGAGVGMAASAAGCLTMFTIEADSLGDILVAVFVKSEDCRM